MRFTKVVLAAMIALTGSAGATLAVQRSGDSPMQNGATGVVRAAAETTKKTGSSRVSLDMKIDALGESMTIRGDGAIDYLAQVGTLTISMKGAELPEGLDVGFQVIFADGVVYMRAPVPMFGPKPWVKMDVGDLAAQQGPGGLGLQNPADMLSFTKNASQVRAVGDDRVRGVQTTHYTMTLDVGKELAESDPSLADLLDGTGFDAVPAELWVDGNGLVRRVSLDMSGFVDAMMKEMAEPGDDRRSSEVTMKMTMEFFDFGTPVDVKLPDPSEVGDMADLMDEAATDSSSV